MTPALYLMHRRVQVAIAMALLRLHMRYPDIKVEVSIDPALTDIVTEQYDAGVRLGEQIARDMIALRVGPDLRRTVVGCPAYFADHGIPVEPQDLTHHRCCNIRLPTSGGLYTWEFERDGRSVKVHVDGPFVLNDMDLLIDAALHGAGLAMVMEDMVASFIADGRLVRVLEDWSPPFSGYHSITLTGTAPRQRSQRFWRNYGPTLIYKQRGFQRCRSQQYLFTPQWSWAPPTMQSRKPSEAQNTTRFRRV